MNRIRTKALAALMLAVLAAVAVSPAPSNARRQFNNNPPTYCCGPTFDFCGAINHEHGPIVETYGRPAHPLRGFVASTCANTGHTFYGNVFHLQYWSQKETFWWDSYADPNVATKISIWEQHPNEPLTLRYCSVCKMIISVTSPLAPN